MQADPSASSSGPLQAGAVAALWRYPVKSMMGEELNSSQVTGRGLLGDRQFVVVDCATGKVGGAKNPRKWGNFFDFRAAYAQPPQAAATMPPVRITLKRSSWSAASMASTVMPRKWLPGFMTRRSAAIHNSVMAAKYAAMGTGSTQHQHLVQTEVPVKLLEEGRRPTLIHS